MSNTDTDVDVVATELLDTWANIKLHLDALEANYHAARDALTTKAMAAFADEFVTLEAQHVPDLMSTRAMEVAAKIAVEKFAMEKQRSFVARLARITYRRGATTWDTDKLSGYAVAHPEILAFKKPEGKPSVVLALK